MFDKILVASDGSSSSMTAARIGAAIADAFSGELTVITVAYLPQAYEQDLSIDMRKAYIDDWKHVLRDTLREIERQGIEAQGKLIREEEPLHGLLREVEAGGYDLLIVGRTGTGSPSSNVMGSVSRGVADNASCAVLVVR